MNVLAINCGSSSLKFQVIEASLALPGKERRLAQGLIDRIGGDGCTFEFTAGGGQPQKGRAGASDHADAARRMLAWLDSVDLAYGKGYQAVGHRVVHGGDRFVAPALIDDGVIEGIEALRELAPLHNEPSLQAIRATREALGSDAPMVAVFDTAFHAAMPAPAARYAIPRELAERHRIRRYGFHGLAHRYMAEQYAVIAGRRLERTRLITLQLGNGCSVTAIEGGKSIDTSMGLTPLEGLVMGTRSGDVDPSLAGFVAAREGVSASEVEGWLNTRSGLLGVSGRSRDMRDLLEAEGQGDSQAALAIEMFCYRASKYVGAYLAALGGADALIFGGGIGENSPEVRARICARMDWCGLTLDPQRNARPEASKPISASQSRIQVYVVPVDEAAIIARDTVRCLQG